LPAVNVSPKGGGGAIFPRKNLPFDQKIASLERTGEDLIGTLYPVLIKTGSFSDKTRFSIKV
jgi:hypothetical protein